MPPEGGLGLGELPLIDAGGLQPGECRGHPGPIGGAPFLQVREGTPGVGLAQVMTAVLGFDGRQVDEHGGECPGVFAAWLAHRPLADRQGLPIERLGVRGSILFVVCPRHEVEGVGEPGIARFVGRADAPQGTPQEQLGLGGLPLLEPDARQHDQRLGGGIIREAEPIRRLDRGPELIRGLFQGAGGIAPGQCLGDPLATRGKLVLRHGGRLQVGEVDTEITRDGLGRGGTVDRVVEAGSGRSGDGLGRRGFGPGCPGHQSNHEPNRHVTSHRDSLPRGPGSRPLAARGPPSGSRGPHTIARDVDAVQMHSIPCRPRRSASSIRTRSVRGDVPTRERYALPITSGAGL